jgi:hypothetical protein
MSPLFLFKKMGVMRICRMLTFGRKKEMRGFMPGNLLSLLTHHVSCGVLWPQLIILDGAATTTVPAMMAAALKRRSIQ